MRRPPPPPYISMSDKDSTSDAPLSASSGDDGGGVGRALPSGTATTHESDTTQHRTTEHHSDEPLPPGGSRACEQPSRLCFNVFVVVRFGCPWGCVLIREGGVKKMRVLPCKTLNP